jgi:pilus assembly protein CpaF
VEEDREKHLAATREGVPASQDAPLPEGTSHGLLEMMEASSLARLPNPGEAAAVTEDVIDRINRDFPAEVLQRPSHSDRRQVEASIAAAVRSAAARKGLSIPEAAFDGLCADLARRLMGLGFLDLLLPPARNDITEIAIYSSGLIQGMSKRSVRWKTIDMRVPPAEIWRVLDRLLGPQNKVLNEANPSVHARLPASEHNPGGGRIKALHPAIVPPGRNPAVNIRLFEQAPVHPNWLIEMGLASKEVFDELRNAVGEGLRILISGGTRTGKTTLLSALCNYLPKEWRIVKIEDPQEIWIDRNAVQTIEARPAAVGTEVRPYSLADGVDDALRLSPDYLIVGEVRDGKAALALFRAMMTGHSGMCTFHAYTPGQALERLATVMAADTGVARDDALEMISSSIDMVVQLRICDEVRRIASVHRVWRRHGSSGIRLRPMFRFIPESSPDAPEWECLWTPKGGVRETREEEGA